MKKIIMSMAMIAAVGAVVVGATGAFFSDTETSKGNTFTAGAIDLQIDNESYYNYERSPENSWDLDDLNGKVFFSFEDLKPGDHGEDTISLHVNNNPAWLCANFELTSAWENGMTEPEKKEGDKTWGQWGGELDDELQWFFWADDGDNVWEEGEDILINKETLAKYAMEDGRHGKTYAIADSSDDTRDAIQTDETIYVAKAWCYGDLEITKVDNQTGSDDQDPLEAKQVTCNGEPVTNMSQTDKLTGNVSFYAVQKRNNEDFKCSDWVMDDGDDELTISYGQNWPDYIDEYQKNAQAEGRLALRDGAWEIAIGTNTGDSSSQNNNGTSPELQWDNGQAHDFTLTYDETNGDLTFHVSNDDGVTPVTFNVGTGLQGDLYFVARASTGASDNVEISNVVIDGMNVGGSVKAETNEKEYMKVSGADLSDGLSVSGEVVFNWTSGETADSMPAFQIQIGE